MYICIYILLTTNPGANPFSVVSVSLADTVGDDGGLSSLSSAFAESCVRRNRFLKVSSPLNLLYETLEQLTFENVYLSRERAENCWRFQFCRYCPPLPPEPPWPRHERAARKNFSKCQLATQSTLLKSQ